MDEVSVKTAINLIREYCDREGIPFSSLLDGVAYTEDQLRNDKGRISWEGFRRLMENVGRIWNDELLEEMGRKFVSSKSMRKFRTAYQMFISPKDFYKWLYSGRSPGRQDFTCIISSVSDLGRNRLLGILQMEEGYKPCREFYIITKGAMTELSTIIGFPSSKVEMNLVGDAAYYDITVSEGVKVLAFIRYIIRWPINLFLAKRELRVALESLQEAYVEIVHAKNNLEVRVQERTTELKQAQKVRERIFANISHEFRTPLTLIQGPVEKMLSEEVQYDKREQYKMILNNSHRLFTLVNQLLDLSKIESGKMNLHARELNIVEVVRSSAALFDSFADRKGIKFSIVTPGEEIFGLFDRDCIEKILINLLSNAFKFTAKGGIVTITLTSSEGFAELTVADTGIGIPPDELDKIFNRFYQIEVLQSTEQEGTGIGLAHTKELVELHKGEITVISEKGIGSSFIVRLPIGKEHFRTNQTIELKLETKVQERPVTKINEQEPVELEEKDKFDEIRPLLLIVEDNPDMRKYMRMYLDDLYTIIEAVNGSEGITKAVETIPNLIISDVMMPKMNGYEVCRQLKTDERTSHIPVILLTAKASIESKLEGLETGADSYLTKPFNSKELLIRVKNLIEQRRKLREKFSGEEFTKPDRLALPSIEKKFLNKVKEAIEKNLSDEKLTVESLAREVAMSRSQLHRKLHGIVNCSPGEFIMTTRLEHAVEMIRQNNSTISEIAYSTGFNTPNYFAKCFRKKFGCTPSKYKVKIN